jgi:anaphase-promoting complex subunit 2
MYSRFDYYLCRAFFDIRTDELFNMIVDYPDSLGGLEDLRVSARRGAGPSL